MTSVHLLGTYRPGSSYQWPCWAEPKIDGFRALAMCDEDGTWSMRSRHGSDWTALCSGILKALARAMPDAAGLVLDGELASHTWLDTKAEVDARRLRSVRFHVWDVLPLSDYMSGCCTMPTEQRREALCALGLAKARRWVSVVKRTEVADEAAFAAVYRQHRAKGYEGAVLKMRGTPWALCREHWYKCKPGEGWS